MMLNILFVAPSMRSMMLETSIGISIGAAIVTILYFKRRRSAHGLLNTEELILQPISVLHDQKTTIIVGGGICGLSIAYHLAQKQKETGIHGRIIIIDALADIFRAVSCFNSGVLAYKWHSGDLKEFAEYSFKVYQTLLEKETAFRDSCGYRYLLKFDLIPQTGASMAKPPAWLQVPDGWHVLIDPKSKDAGAINPVKLGQWLVSQCIARHVAFYSHSRLVKVDLTDEGTIDMVHIRHGAETYKLPCQSLVLAAGAWTPSLFNDVFPLSNCPMYPKISSGNYITVKIPAKTELNYHAQVTLTTDNGSRLEFVDRGDGTIFICGLNNTETPICDVEDEAPPDEDAISEMQAYAKRFLAAPQDQQTVQSRAATSTTELVTAGRTYRPLLSRQLPIITRVPANKLLMNARSSKACPADQGEVMGGGVYVCYGHGSFGLTDGMGSGVLMSQLILGLKTDVDMDKFGLPV